MPRAKPSRRARRVASEGGVGEASLGLPKGNAWARTAAALPQAARRRREQPFWRSVVRAWGWKRVVDAGCGAGFHLRLLADLGVESYGFDLAPAVLPRGAPVVAADLLCPPFAVGVFDAALCLGNTLSLLPSRALQLHALRVLAMLVRPGGTVLVQGEAADVLARDGPCARVRWLAGGAVHIRVFERAGRRVRMLAGVVTPAAEARLAETLLLPTLPGVVTRLARQAKLRVVALPAPPPASSVGWWLALSVPLPGS
jgi:SAM-dependent methyltransferase